MRLLHSCLLAAILAISCSASPAPSANRPPSASPTPLPAAPLTIRAPLDDLLSGGQAGLAPTAVGEHLSLTEAASLEENQPLALTRFRAWGWVDQASRSWGDGGRGFTDSLLLLTRAEGARLAFQGFAGDLAREAPCPASLGLDQCAQGAGGLVARIDRYVFRLMGSGVDLAALAALQAEAVRKP